ncbi:MAG: CoA pyrophosphatase [Peptococcaceae bacterium]|nr:CoA pyrophosphatase [Peptococcaceae bacterium]MDH7524703.1 CoA pyrophosphatase [Peptococcaceae bacterium]
MPGSKSPSIENVINALRLRKPGVLDDQGYSEYAVLLPLMMYRGELSLLFEVRSQSLKGQPGEICFPGGQKEPGDKSPRDTAIREASEELGIKKTSIKTAGALDVLWTHHQLKIHPYAAFIDKDAVLRPDPAEVEEIFFVPLESLLKMQPLVKMVRVRMELDADFPYHLVPGGKNYPWRTGEYPVYFYEYEKYIIWGLTARILHHFLDLIR